MFATEFVCSREDQMDTGYAIACDVSILKILANFDPRKVREAYKIKRKKKPV